MGGLYSAFILAPGLSAALVGYLVDDWRLAGALAALTLALTALVMWLAIPFGTFVLPFFAGATVGAASLTVYLKLRPETSVWDRMLAAMATACAAGYALLLGLARAGSPVG